MPDSPRPADAALLDDLIQTMRDVEWSVALDCLHHETLTPHGRQVLTDAPDLLSRLAARLSETREAGEEHPDTARLDWLDSGWCTIPETEGRQKWAFYGLHGETLREAIDAARGAPSGPSTGETTP